MSLLDWSTNPSNNTAKPNIDWSEGQLPSTVNGSARAMMADVATWLTTPVFSGPISTVGGVTSGAGQTFARLEASGDIRAARDANSGAYYFGATGVTRYLFFDGTDFLFSGGGLKVPGNVAVTGAISATGGISAATGTFGTATSPSFTATGAAAQFAMQDRDAPGSAANWVLYNQTGALRFFQGSDRASLSPLGVFTLAGVAASGTITEAGSRVWTAATLNPANYATTNALTTGLAGKQNTGDYATNTALTTGLAGKQNVGNYIVTNTDAAVRDVTAARAAQEGVIYFGSDKTSYIYLSGGFIEFFIAGVKVAKVDGSGNWTVKGNIVSTNGGPL